MMVRSSMVRKMDRDQDRLDTKKKGWIVSACGIAHMGVSIIGTPIAGWFIREYPSYKWRICGYPYFRKPPCVRFQHIAGLQPRPRTRMFLVLSLLNLGGWVG